MQPTKVYKFAAATVMTTVAAATVITFTNAEQAGSSPVAAVLPRVPAAGGAAPSVGINEQTPRAVHQPDPGSEHRAEPVAEPGSHDVQPLVRPCDQRAGETQAHAESAIALSDRNGGGLGGLLGDLLGG